MTSGLTLMLVTLCLTAVGVRRVWRAFSAGQIGAILMTYLITSMIGVPMLMTTLAVWSGLDVAAGSPIAGFAFICASPILALLCWIIAWLPFGFAGALGGTLLSLACPGGSLRVRGCARHGIPQAAFVEGGVGVRRNLPFLQFEGAYLCLMTFMSGMLWIALLQIRR